MAGFSADRGGPNAGQGHPGHQTPSGNVGQQAAQKALRPPRRGQAQQRGPSGGAQRSTPPSLGHPNFDQQGAGQGQQDDQQDQGQDNRHLALVGDWHNMVGLGRDIPWTVWASLTGGYRQLAKPGQPMFDIFEDV